MASSNTQVYIWDGDGPYARRESAGLVVYRKNDEIELTPAEAYYVRGSITTEGGLKIPESSFSKTEHPYVEPKKASTPHDRPGGVLKPTANVKPEPKIDTKADADADAKFEAAGAKAAVGTRTSARASAGGAA